MVVGCLFSQSALKYSSSQLCVIRLIVGAHSCVPLRMYRIQSRRAITHNK